MKISENPDLVKWLVPEVEPILGETWSLKCSPSQTPSFFFGYVCRLRISIIQPTNQPTNQPINQSIKLYLCSTFQTNQNPVQSALQVIEKKTWYIKKTKTGLETKWIVKWH